MSDGKKARVQMDDPYEAALADAAAGGDDPYEQALAAGGGDQADPGFKPWSQPGDAGSPTQTRAGGRSRYVNPERGSLSSLLADTGADAVQGLAGGAFSGLGINPSQTFGDRVRARQELAADRSPTATGAGKLIGEAAIQTAAAPAALARAPAAAGALSGFLSGVGNTDGTVGEKLRSGVGGAAIGAPLGAASSYATGKLQSLLERKAAQYGENQATHGLMNLGSGADDLARLDAQGGRQQFYDEGRRLGITGKPQAAAPIAKQVASDAEATRAAIEARNAGVQVDPNATAAAVRGANPYPGVQRMDRAADRAANGVQAAGPGLGAMDTQRAYYGNSSNFASGSPNQVLGQRVHGAINNEMEDAINLANPGEGSAWRQAGRDERTGLELGGIAQKAADTRRAAPWTGGDVMTGGALRVLNNNRHGIAEAGYGAASSMAGGGAKLGSLLEGAPAAFSGDVGGRYSAENSKPLRVDQAALDLLGGGSKGAELGQWRDEIAAAAGSPDTGAVQATITRLTMSSPEFRMRVLPLLRQHAGGQ